MKHIILIILLLLSSFAHTQFPVGTKVLKRPIDFRIPKESVAKILTHSDLNEGLEPWFVYSDKKTNWTFEQAGGIKPYKKMDYLQQFAVVEEKGNYIRLARAESYDTKTYLLDSKAENYGWVKKNDVLLWINCIVTDAGGIERKAMIMNTLNLVASKANIHKLEDNSVEFYYESSLREPTGRKAQLYEVFFAYKITDTAVLIGNVSRISDETERSVKESILGWVPLNRVVMWDHRVAIEPNWTETAVASRIKDQVRASVFSKKYDAEQYMSRKSNSGIAAIMDEKSIKGDYYRERMIGEWQRYPVYEEKNNIARVGVMGQIVTEKGEFDKVDKAVADREIRVATTKRRNINIAFVIDGTNSMTPYFTAVSSAILSSMESLEKKYPTMKNVIRFGAVIYRDYSERSRVIELKELTSNYKDISSFLNKIDAKDIFDKDIPEAVNYGLFNALNAVLTGNNETNLIVLIGDAGNHNRNDNTQFSSEEISEIIAEKNTGFLAFQVHNDDSHPSYDEFRSQVQKLMLDAAGLIYDATLLKKPNDIIKKPGWSDLGNNTMRLDNYINMATMVYANKGQVMNTSLLSDEINQLVDYSVSFTDQLLSGVSQVITGGSSLKDIADSDTENQNKYVSSFSPALFHFLYNQTNIPKEKLEYLVENKYQLYTEGYAPLILTGQSEPLFRKVLLLSRTDLSKVINNIDRLYKATNRNDRRIVMQETFIDMIQRHIGRKDAADLMKMTIEEVNTRIYGLPGTSSIINKLKLEDLTNPGVISDAELQNYAHAIEMKYKTLNRIMNESSVNPYKYSLTMSEIVYYWIEDDLLP